MKRYQKNETVTFLYEDKQLYGEIAEAKQVEDRVVYTIYVGAKKYQNIEEKRIIRSYGEIDD